MKFAAFPKFALLSVSCCLAVALAGCGSDNNIALTQGNWSVVATPTEGDLIYVGGNLTQSGSNLTGQFYIFNSECFSFSHEIDFTGTVDGNKVTFVSPVVDGQTVTVTTTASSPSSFSGTYSVSGGCDDGDSGTVSGSPVASITGNWSGTLEEDEARGRGAKGHAVKARGVKGNGELPSITIALTQATGASSDGTFALTGTVSYVNSCSESGTVTSGFIAGQYIVIEASTDDGDGQFSYVDVLLNSPTAPTTMNGTYDLTGDCGEDLENLILTKVN